MFIDKNTIQELINESKVNSSRRSHLLLHNSIQNKIQELAFCIQPDTIIDVHKHKSGTETIICLKGEMAITFLDGNEIKEIVILNQSNPVLKFDPKVWHTYTSLLKDTVAIEIKEGPYSKDNFINHSSLNSAQIRLDLNESIYNEIR